ncbi:class I SAM-dependent RNA methyltransferase [Haematomicrobium sanguinis]|uniref:class I SAM-dependent RNA methyltransferase n=1 Tax=Haematomicrobium sanguinis TaxID=479106 RepID=UPI00047A27C4|nr:TRAM domain-containing protein [Haematomicrobium sanguinis]
MELELDITAAAHGGHFIARHEGRVIFVRHALPGERVRARVMENDGDARFWRADVTDIVVASADRQKHPWQLADALAAARDGRTPVGGAEFGHIAPGAAREIKGDIYRELVTRFAGTDAIAPHLLDSLAATPMPGEHPDGLGWRTRVGFAVGEDGRLGMHPHRSNAVIPLTEMPLAAELDPAIFERDYSGFATVDISLGTLGDNGYRQASVLGNRPLPPRRGRTRPTPKPPVHLAGSEQLTETVLGRELTVSAAGFWQIHRSAPEALAANVREWIDLKAGDTAWDLYAGAGLFTSVLAEAVGESGTVHAIEGSPVTSANAAANFAHQPQVNVTRARVDQALERHPGRVHAVVLDPPRSGAGKKVVEQISASTAEKVVYVSCDPASFARDLADMRRNGWQVADVKLWDMYPNTHHMESVTLFTRERPGAARARH